MTPRAVSPPGIRFTVELKPADFVAARRLTLTPRPAMQRILWLWAGVFVPCCLWLTYFGWVRGRWHPLLMPILGTGLFLAFYVFVVMPWNARQAFAPQEVSGELSDEGLTLQTGASRDTLRWPEIRRWLHNDKIVLLFVTDDLFNVVPLRAFSADERAAALALIEQKLGPPRSP